MVLQENDLSPSKMYCSHVYACSCIITCSSDSEASSYWVTPVNRAGVVEPLHWSRGYGIKVYCKKNEKKRRVD